VLVATKALDRGAVLKTEDLKEISWPSGKPPQGSLTSREQVVGLTVLNPLDAGQPLTAKTVSPRGATGGVSLAIPEGMRAVSIHPNDSGGVVVMLRSGLRVDILMLDARGGPNGEMVLKKLLQNVEVLSTGGPEASGGRPVVTLLVTPGQADRLTLADAVMQIRLVLRNPSDQAFQTPESLSPADLRRATPQADPAQGGKPVATAALR
jgi:pilus assembly protein CpaB